MGCVEIWVVWKTFFISLHNRQYTTYGIVEKFGIDFFLDMTVLMSP